MKKYVVWSYKCNRTIVPLNDEWNISKKVHICYQSYGWIEYLKLSPLFYEDVQEV